MDFPEGALNPTWIQVGCILLKAVFFFVFVFLVQTHSEKQWPHVAPGLLCLIVSILKWLSSEANLLL